MMPTNMSLANAVFKYADIKSSSDFIVVLSELSKRVDLNIDTFSKSSLVFGWEYENWHDIWESNVNFIGSKMVGLDIQDYAIIGQSYTDIIDYFLENKEVSKVFPLDETDPLGWQIYKELTEKRNLATKHFNIAETQE